MGDGGRRDARRGDRPRRDRRRPRRRSPWAPSGGSRRVFALALVPVGRADRRRSASRRSRRVAIARPGGRRASPTRCSTSSGLTLLQRGTANDARGRRCSRSSRSWRASASRSAASLALAADRDARDRAGARPRRACAAGRSRSLGWPLVRRLDDEGVVPERQAALLRGIPLFAPLPLAASSGSRRACARSASTPGERLMTQGEAGDTFVVIEDGRGRRRRWTAAPHHARGPGRRASARSRCCARSRGRRRSPRSGPWRRWAIDCETFVDAVTGHEGSAAAAERVVESRLHAGAGSSGPAEPRDRGTPGRGTTGRAARPARTRVAGPRARRPANRCPARTAMAADARSPTTAPPTPASATATRSRTARTAPAPARCSRRSASRTTTSPSRSSASRPRGSRPCPATSTSGGWRSS